MSATDNNGNCFTMGNMESLSCLNTKSQSSRSTKPANQRSSPYSKPPKPMRNSGSSPRSSWSPNRSTDVHGTDGSSSWPPKIQSPDKSRPGVIVDSGVSLTDERMGSFRGIQAPTESSLLACILFAFFYRQDIFDEYLLKTTESDSTHSGLGSNISKIRSIIENRIIGNMRRFPYLSWLNEWHLLKDLYSKDLYTMDKDPESAFNFIFNEVLEIKSFVEFNKFETGFLYQLICPRSLENKTSNIQISDLKAFKTSSPPVLSSPFLILGLKRVNNNLPFVFPTELPLLPPNSEGSVELLAVICDTSPPDIGSWKAFVRSRNDATNSITWIFFDPQSQTFNDSGQDNIPKVELLPEFEKHLQYLRTSETASANSAILQDGSLIGERLKTLLFYGLLFIFYDPNDPRLGSHVSTRSLRLAHQSTTSNVQSTREVQDSESQLPETRLYKNIKSGNRSLGSLAKPDEAVAQAVARPDKHLTLSSSTKKFSKPNLWEEFKNDESTNLGREKHYHLENPRYIHSPCTSTKVITTHRPMDTSINMSKIVKTDTKASKTSGELARLDVGDFRKLFTSKYQEGNGFGLEGQDNSCYLDSTIFSMLYVSKIFDEWLLLPKLSTNPTSPVGKRIRNILQSQIIDNLRGNHFVPYPCTLKLRQALGEVNPRLWGSMMDVDELVSTLMGKGLELRKFINYSIGTGNYMHQIMIDTKQSEMKVTSVQLLLEASMKFQSLNFQNTPCPALIIKMPRSQGQLLGCNEILPNLTLDLSSIMIQGSAAPFTKMQLGAIIALKNCHYTSYARWGLDSSSPWLYFDSMPARVKLVPNLGEELELAQEVLEGRLSGDGLELSTHFHRLISNIHICIYYSPETVLQMKHQLLG